MRPCTYHKATWVAVISKSVTKWERIKDNCDTQSLQFDEDDIEKLNGLNWNKRNYIQELWNDFDFVCLPIFR